MGVFSHLVVYGLGRRRGRKQTQRQVARARSAGPHPDVFSMSEECSNYESFCKNFGSCDGMECEYDGG